MLKNIKTAEEWLELARGSGMDDRSVKELKDELKKAKTASSD
jgi:hypothetical protein